MIVEKDGEPVFGFAMGYDPGQERGELTRLLDISRFGKLYPKGFQGVVSAGETRTISGYFGSYDLRPAP